jgi:hypothetical protein
MKNVKNFTTCLCEPHLERPIEEISRACGNPLARTRRIGGPHGYALVGGLDACGTVNVRRSVGNPKRKV